MVDMQYHTILFTPYINFRQSRKSQGRETEGSKNFLGKMNGGLTNLESKICQNWHVWMAVGGPIANYVLV